MRIAGLQLNSIMITDNLAYRRLVGGDQPGSNALAVSDSDYDMHVLTQTGSWVVQVPGTLLFGDRRTGNQTTLNKAASCLILQCSRPRRRDRLSGWTKSAVRP